jgi:mannose-6-phosphate isomerase-like protein (cupin superfamily)
MGHLNLIRAAAELPQPWTSSVVTRVGNANLKIVRMDEAPYPDESHDYSEGLLVLDGHMTLAIGGVAVEVRSGEIYVVPPGVVHSVAAGSRGTLVIFDVA